MTNGEWYIIAVRGRSQAHTRIFKAKLCGERAIAIDKKLAQAVELGWLSEAYMQAVILIEQKKAMVAERIVESLCDPAFCTRAELQRLDDIMRAPDGA